MLKMTNLERLREHIELGQLFALYKDLLPENKRAAMEAYLAEDLTLSEIAENEGKSRQAVHAQVKDARKHLYDFERRLGLLQKTELYQELEDELRRRILDGSTDESLRLLDAIRGLLALDTEGNEAYVSKFER